MAALDSIFLFADLPPETMAAIEARATWHEFAPDQQIFDKESDSFDVSGSVRILRAVDTDREVALADLGAGHFFGELAAIDGGKRSARVVALEPSLLASLSGSAFEEVMAISPLVTRRVLLRMAQIIRGLDNRVSELSTLSESQRIMVELIRLTQPDPRQEGGYYIPDFPNHRDIAGWAGTDREAVARTIGELTRLRVLERRNMSLIIRDWSQLRAMARADKKIYPGMMAVTDSVSMEG